MPRNPFEDYFHYIKADRRAILILGGIGVFCVGVCLVLDALRTKNTDPITAADSLLLTQKRTTPPVQTEPAPLHKFDPNTVDSLTLVAWGIAPKKVMTFLRYRRAGKVFRSAADLGDTYGWTDEDVSRLEPYMVIPENARHKKEVQRTREDRDSTRTKNRGDSLRFPVKFDRLTLVDANEADSATLRRIPGIGEVIAGAIIKYRNRLGGFHHKEQLAEINNVSPEILDWFVVADSPTLRPIPVNRASFQTLNQHPYISYDQTRDLLTLIRLHGPVADQDQLLNTNIFSPDELTRLLPYLDFGNAGTSGSSVK